MQKEPCHGQTRGIFICWVVLQGVQPKEGVLADQKAKGEVKPSNVINLTALVFDKNDQVAEIYAARQLSYDEAHRKVHSFP